MSGIITLQQIRDAGPCTEGWRKLLTSLGNPSDMSITVSIGDVGKSNDAQDALWCVRVLPETERRNIVRCIFPAVKRAAIHTTDKRVSDCIEAIEKWLSGDETVDLRAAARAAYAAAAAARAAYASYAARVTAYAARAAAYAAYAAYAARAADASYAADAARAAADAAYAARAAARASYAADAAVGAAARAEERKQQTSDIIAVYPLHALKD